MKVKSKSLLILGLVSVLLANLILKDSVLSDLARGLVTRSGFGFLILSIYLKGKNKVAKI